MITEIECKRHGKGRAGFICQHLIGYAGRGFNPQETSEEEDPCAYCDKCMKILDEENGWTERAKQEIPLAAVCLHCFDEIGFLNTIEWNPPSITSEVQSEVFRRQQSLCAKCGKTSQATDGNFVFVTPPHAMTTQAAVSWSESTENVVFLCSGCCPPQEARISPVIEVKMRNSAGHLTDCISARPVGLGLYRLLQDLPGLENSKGRIVEVALEREDSRATAGPRYYVFRALTDAA